MKIRQKIKYKIKEFIQFVRLSFYPKITLISCVVISLVILTVLAVIMAAVPRDSFWYSLLFAVTTGASGSFFVSVIVEMCNNYKRNKLAWHELQDYYNTILDYEMNKQIMMQKTPHQKAEKKAREDHIAAGGANDPDEDDEPKDIVQITWESLPTIIPVLKDTFENKKAFLGDAEINALWSIMSEYEQIRRNIHLILTLSPIEYDVINYPDEEILKSIYPQNVLNDMPEWMRKQIATNKSDNSLDMLTNEIMTDRFMLSYYMKDYDISKISLEEYEKECEDIEKSESEFSRDDVEYEEPEYDFTELENEEEFKAMHLEINKRFESSQKDRVSGMISKCCFEISLNIDILEKSLFKQPLYGEMIKYYKKIDKEPTNDAFSKMVYEHERKWLENDT